MKTYRIPIGGVRHYVQGQGIILPGGTYRADAPLADGDVEEGGEAPKARGRKVPKEVPPPSAGEASMDDA